MITPSTSPQELANLLNVKLQWLNFIVYKKQLLDSYESFEIEKKNGETRTILAPNRPLKAVQRKLVDLLEQSSSPHSAATAFIKEKGIVFNAKKHLKKTAVFNIDLEDFFGSIHFGRIYGMFIAPPYSLQSETARLIANLCCYDRKLPQGAPTSPLVSNLICRSFDRDMSHLAKQNSAYYSRYADDITFSFSHLSSQNIFTENRDPSSDLTALITQHGFKINQQKTRVQYKNERQVVTGLKVNRKINIDRRYIRTTRAMVHSMTLDLDNAREKFRSKYPEHKASLDNVVHGRITYIGMVKGKHSSVYRTLASNFNTIGLNIRIKLSTENDQKINFNTVYKSKINLLQKAILVVSFEGYQENNEIDEFVQGSAFCIAKNIFVTAAHTFKKSGATKGCFLKFASGHDKFHAKIISRIDRFDIAFLRLETNTPATETIVPLSISQKLKTINSGYELLLAGFPKYADYHAQLSLIEMKVIKSSYKRHHAEYMGVDKDIEGGASGAPLLNAYCEVIGMALQGRTVEQDEEEFIIDGENSFISARHFKTPFLELNSVTSELFSKPPLK
ncbi:reverse transcriptase domain-containing protein [Marinomonas sp. THO17]|uniref:reverse transcriptase domain-containing protein n=1 Tax=Marinomonas sp. THO17 TaxID=3149048 RepID=UPI00336C09C9